MGPRLRLLIFASETAQLAIELLISTGPSPHLWFLREKMRLLDQNYKTLWVPDFAL